LVTLNATQHFLLELSGSTIYHQPPSPLLPTIWELVPTFNPLSASHSVPGPRRQLTGCSLGNAIGTLGVEVAVGGGVFEGGAVCVGKGGVADGGTAVGVAGVSVAVGPLDGRLQLEIANAKTSMDNKTCDFITLSFIGLIILIQMSRRWQ